MVADNPIIPFIRGDGTVDIWPATQKVLDAAVTKAYGGSKSIEWFKVYAGDEAATSTAPTSTCRRTPSRRSAPTAWPWKPSPTSGRWYPFTECGPAPIFDLYSLRASCRYEGTRQASPRSGRNRLPGEHQDIYMGVEWEADGRLARSCASTSTRS